MLVVIVTPVFLSVLFILRVLFLFRPETATVFMIREFICTILIIPPNTKSVLDV